MNASISPIKRITSIEKTDNNTFSTTSTIETVDFGQNFDFLSVVHIF